MVQRVQKPTEIELEATLINWGTEKKSKDVLLKDIFLYFFYNQMAPTIFDNQENAPL